MQTRTKISSVAAATTALLVATQPARATVTVSTDTTWSSGTYSEDVVIAGGAKLTVNGDVSTTGKLKVGDANGGAVLEVTSGTVHANERICFYPEALAADWSGTTASADFLSEVIVKQYAIASSRAGLNNNCRFPSAVRFQGGKLQFSSGSVINEPLFVSAQGETHLVGEGGDILLFFNWNNSITRYFLKDFGPNNTSPRLVFEGDCDVVMDANQYVNLRMQSYGSSVGDKLANGYKTVAWNQTGDLVLKNYILMTLDGDMMLPYGAQTGGVVLNGSGTRLDFNGRRTAVNAITVTQGLVTNSSATAATLVLGLDNADANISDIVKADLKGVFNYEKAGSGTLTIDKGAYGTLTVAGGAVAFAATSATPANRQVNIGTLDVISGFELVVDGMRVVCDTATGADISHLAISTRNGGEFVCENFGATGTRYIYDFNPASGNRYAKLGTQSDILVATNAISGGVSVRQGRLELRPDWDGSHSQLVRFKFTKSYGNQPLSLCNMQFWKYGDNRTQVARADGAQAGCYQKVATLSELVSGDNNYGQIFCESELQSGSTELVELFNPNNTWDGHVKFTAVPTEESPITIAVNLRWWNASTKLCGYNFLKKGNMNTGVMAGLPVSWIVETSSDGTTWIEVDRRTDCDPPTTAWKVVGFSGSGTRSTATTDNNLATYFPIAGCEVGGAGGFSASSVVRVDAGAVLDTTYVADSERTISALEIDMAVGGGHITTFAPAANGVLDVVNLQGTLNENTDLGLTFDSIVGAGNLSTWTVRVNGVAKTKRIIARDGKLVVVADATVLYVR